jgi:hypothetical protein
VITFFDFIFEDWVKLLSRCSKVKRVLFTGSHLRERSQIPAITFFDFICFFNWIFPPDFSYYVEKFFVLYLRTTKFLAKRRDKSGSGGNPDSE